jgi:hypothetical protein
MKNKIKQLAFLTLTAAALQINNHHWQIINQAGEEFNFIKNASGNLMTISGPGVCYYMINNLYSYDLYDCHFQYLETYKKT